MYRKKYQVAPSLLEEFDLTKAQVPLLSFLIESPQDLNLFRTKFWNGQRNSQTSAISDFRLWKIQNKIKKRLSFTRFERLFGCDAQYALEKLTQRPVGAITTNAILNDIKESKYQLHTIFDICMDNPQLSINRVRVDAQ
jgi:hypothetical protein